MTIQKKINSFFSIESQDYLIMVNYHSQSSDFWKTKTENNVLNSPVLKGFKGEVSKHLSLLLL